MCCEKYEYRKVTMFCAFGLQVICHCLQRFYNMFCIPVVHMCSCWSNFHQLGPSDQFQASHWWCLYIMYFLSLLHLLLVELNASNYLSDYNYNIFQILSEQFQQALFHWRRKRKKSTKLSFQFDNSINIQLHEH